MKDTNYEENNIINTNIVFICPECEEEIYVESVDDVGHCPNCNEIVLKEHALEVIENY